MDKDPYECRRFMRGICFYELGNHKRVSPYILHGQGCFDCPVYPRTQETEMLKESLKSNDELYDEIKDDFDHEHKEFKKTPEYKYTVLRMDVVRLIEKEEKRTARFALMVEEAKAAAEKMDLDPTNIIPVDYGNSHLIECPYAPHDMGNNVYDLAEMCSPEQSKQIREVVMKHLIKCPFCKAIHASRQE